jgi:hypothetical protein
MKIEELLIEDEEPKILKLRGFGASEKTKEWVADVKSRFYNEGNNSYIFWNHEGNIIPLGKEETKDIAAYVQFELVPKQQNAVQIKWFQATPLRSGYGDKAMKILQDLARPSGIKFVGYAFDKGVVPQSKLIKFYKKQGFTSKDNSGNMVWEPEVDK